MPHTTQTWPANKLDTTPSRATELSLAWWAPVVGAHKESKLKRIKHVLSKPKAGASGQSKRKFKSSLLEDPVTVLSQVLSPEHKIEAQRRNTISKGISCFSFVEVLCNAFCRLPSVLLYPPSACPGLHALFARRPHGVPSQRHKLNTKASGRYKSSKQQA